MTDHRKQCPTCRQFLPLPMPLGLRLNQRQREIIAYVRKGGDSGVTIDNLVDHIYQHDPNGGPITARKVIYVTIHNLNKKLVTKGYAIRGRHAGQGSLGEYFFTRVNGS
jgi:hypothetical protein